MNALPDMPQGELPDGVERRYYLNRTRRQAVAVEMEASKVQYPDLMFLIEATEHIYRDKGWKWDIFNDDIIRVDR